MSNLSADRSKYFAGRQLTEFLPLLFERVDHFYNHVMESGLLALWRASHMAAYSGFYVGGRMNDVGPNGKFTAVEANEYRNLATHVLNMITSQKSQPQAQARNMDHASQQQTVIANGLAETLSDDKDLERLRQDTAERGLFYGEGWGVPLWNKDLGEVYTTEQNPQLDEAGQPVLDEQGQPKIQEKPLHVGDIEYHAMHPLDVVRDASRDRPQGHRWLTGRRYANRYDLMALYPALADKIAKLPSAMQTIWDGKRPRLYQWYNLRKDDCDEVVIWDFMHEKTPAVPHGRLVSALSDDLALVDDDLPYRELPHIPWSAAAIEGTTFSYSLFFDLLALQQGVNAGVSAIATRMAAFGLPTVTGSPNVRLENLGDGMTCLTYGEGEEKPGLIDFAQIPEGVINFIKMLREFMATYSGINNVARGQPEGGITAASALALLEARAIQFVALSQKADIDFMRRLFTTSLHHYQDHQIADVMVRRVGKDNKARVQSFKAGAFNAVSGYTMGIGNALQATAAGRLQIAEGMKASGVPISPADYIEVATTGRLEPATQGPQKELELIKAENEALSQGQAQRALRTDDHQLHIQEHKIVVADPVVRADPNSPVVIATLDHIGQHEQMIAAQTAPAQQPGSPDSEAAYRATVAVASSPGATGQLQAAEQVWNIAGPPAPGVSGGAPPPAPGVQGGTPPPAGGAATHIPPPPAPPAPGGPPVKVERAQPAKNPMTGAPNPHPMVTA